LSRGREGEKEGRREGGKEGRREGGEEEGGVEKIRNRVREQEKR
jgi:hypothetical protein